MSDYRTSMAARQQSWFGLKRHVKTVLALPAVHPALRTAARLAPGLPVGRLPAPSRLREVTGTARGATFVLQRPDRCEIAKELYWGGGRRPAPEDALALDVVVALTGRADVLLDIGAYTGLFSVAAAAAQPQLRVHAFEIVPAVAAVLRDNVERNDLADRVVIHHRGVGDPDRTMLVPSGDGGSALPSFYSARMTFEEGTPVEFAALDALADDLLADVERPGRVVVKIDVEGAEHEVLSRAQAFLREHRPDILCEVLHGVGDGRALERLLAPHGYRYYLVHTTGVRPAQGIRPDPVFRDWLLTPRDAGELAAMGVPVGA